MLKTLEGFLLRQNTRTGICYIIVVAFLCGQSIVAAVSGAQRSALEAAIDALGANVVKTLQFTASGATFTVGQNFAPDDPWPKITVKSYTALIDFDAASMRQELVREMGATMPRGGGVPFTGELRQIQYSDSRSAWNIPVPEDRRPVRCPSYPARRRNSVEQPPCPCPLQTVRSHAR